MHLIDRYAYGNALRQVDPLHKAGLTLTVIALCLLLNRPVVGLLSAAWMILLAVGLARIPFRTFLGILLAEAAFLLLATIAVILSFSLQRPVLTSGWWVRLGPFWIGTSPQALQQGGNLILRAWGAASATNFLAMTTPMVDLIDLLHRLRMPALIIDLMTLMYRFIFVLLESLERMVRAQNSRLGFNAGYRRRMENAAWIATHLFIEAFLRSRHLQLALASRGYEGGDLRVLPISYRTDSRLLLLSAIVPITLVLAWRIV